jgi:hypothetical protein
LADNFGDFSNFGHKAATPTKRNQKTRKRGQSTLIESIGVSTAATEYRIAAEAAKYAGRPMGLDQDLGVKVTKATIGLFITGSIYEFAGPFIEYFKESDKNK